ncbi:BTAD domain-containing putative transcriptional regulator [Streptomyces sp. NPDC014892]|uniref:AfsR/SARP family transcriptional regulator n=1 Tax=Streptomyces sp. NPDC014892 TaxID=3364930 RepID=UPI003701706F
MPLRPGRVVSAGALIDTVWGDEPPDSARALVQTYVSGLRRVLPAGAEGIETRPPGYLLRVDGDRDRLDLRDFERLRAAGRDRAAIGDHRGASELLGQALELWRGSAPGGVGRALRVEAERLEEARQVGPKGRRARGYAEGRAVLADALGIDPFPAASGSPRSPCRSRTGFAADYPDGQLYAELHGFSDPVPPVEVPARLLRALGTEPPEDPAERGDLFRGLLARRRVLLVLDDAGCEAQVRPLLPGSASCGVLITSRARLAGLDGAARTELDVWAYALLREGSYGGWPVPPGCCPRHCACWSRRATAPSSRTSRRRRSPARTSRAPPSI